jgi:hypothetical protein
MQSVFRILNVVLGPVLTLMFASHFAGAKIAGKDAGDPLGGVLAGLVMLAIELGLTQGPKHSARLRRWLDARAAFEGLWIQDVYEGPDGNRVAVFGIGYLREDDAFAVQGAAYSSDGRRFAIFESTHVFIDPKRYSATYLWKGEKLLEATDEKDKSGRAELSLRRPPALALPQTGEGSVSHLGEKTVVEFRLRRVTRPLLRNLGLGFSLRDLQLDANGEESRLAAAFIRRHADRPSEPL